MSEQNPFTRFQVITGRLYGKKLFAIPDGL
jgi:hypothetical protein